MSRNFISVRKSLPVNIINNHASYFYVLRQNKVVHDMTLERRAKPSAEIISFTPLKLDSVNANWFDYENLDYLAFESNYKFYFLFEKILNAKRTLYLKIIDTTGKSSGFIELASLEGDKNTADLSFRYSKTRGNDLLIIASKTNFSGITRKVALLFSTEKREMLWTKRLPLENDLMNSWNFACNEDHDLFYLQTIYSLLGYDMINGVSYPVTRLDSLLLWQWKSQEPAPSSQMLDLHAMRHFEESFIYPERKSTFLSFQGIERDTATESGASEHILNERISYVGKEMFHVSTPYEQSLRTQLTFYDGPEKWSIFKHHKLINYFVEGRYLYTLSGRADGDYYKELLFRKMDLINGKLLFQKLVPRKIFFFRNRTRFKRMAEPMVMEAGDSTRIVLLENPSNFKRNAETFTNKTFKKEGNLPGANMVCYALKQDGHFEKTLVYKNADFDLIPLHYSSSGQKDMVFYLNNSKYERFAIWRPNP